MKGEKKISSRLSVVKNFSMYSFALCSLCEKKTQKQKSLRVSVIKKTTGKDYTSKYNR